MILDEIQSLSIIPEFGTNEYKEYLKQKEFIKFLLDINRNELPVYISHHGMFINSLFFPSKYLKENYIDNLLKWNFCSDDLLSGYGYHFYKGKKRIKIFKPLEFGVPDLLKKAKPFILLRYFEGRIGKKSYIEICSFFIQLHNLHFIDEKNAYYVLNKSGEIEEIIKIYYLQDYIIVTINKNLLDIHLFLTNSVLLRFFNRKIYHDWSFITREKKREEYKLIDEDHEIFANRIIIFNEKDSPIASSLRGFNIIRNYQSYRRIISILNSNEELNKYEKFIAWDWKNKRIAECSCDPNELCNYFVKSNKPHEMSPVFFKPEVILKYKQDAEKYSICNNLISCRGIWGIPFEVNEVGQIYTYLIYLSGIPYSEQLYLKSYNENPKAGISEKSIKENFRGEFDLTYEPLSELKESLHILQNSKSELWSCNNEELYNILNYPLSDSLEEWQNEIHNLDKLVIEGLNNSYIKKLSKSLNCYKENLGSIKLLKEILISKNFNNDEITIIIRPLCEIHFLRTKFFAHRKSEKTDNIRKEIIKKYNDLKNHFYNLIKSVDNSIKLLINIDFNNK